MNTISNQELFDRVAKHLLTQNEASVANITGDDGLTFTLCAYRGENGLMCGVGCLVSDKEYSPSLEGKSILGTDVKLSVERSLNVNLTSYNLALLNDLQSLHDLSDTDKWARHLRETAYDHGLLDTVVGSYA